MRELTSTVLIGAALLWAPVVAAHEKGSPLDRVDGKYYRGDGLGDLFNLKIGKDQRFRYTLGSDVGLLEKASGKVEVRDGWLTFKIGQTEEGLEPEALTDGRWLRVPWGQRLYLVEEADLLSFANDVNLGREPRTTATGSFLLRRGDHLRQAEGLPNLKKPWDELLFPSPVSCRVVRLLTPDQGEIDAGARQGIRKGHILSGHYTDGTGVDLLVEEVREGTSIVRAAHGNLFQGQRVTSQQ